MLPDKPWKVDALARLFGGVLLSLFFVNSAAASLAHYLREPQDVQAPAYFAAFIASAAFFLAGMFLVQKEWNIERILFQAGLLFLTVYGSFILLWLAIRVQGGLPENVSDQSTWRVVIAVLSFQGVALVLVHPFVRKHGMTWNEAFGLNLAPGKVLLIGAAIGISITPLAWGLQSFQSLLLDRLNVPAPEQEAVEIIRASSAVVNRVVLAIGTILIVPAAEEVLFRGILYPWIKRIGYPRAAIW
ncbi:MAG TPA: CPBP family intramembrane metalloprotease, partial [Verrucomicrobiota bacterium]|nr:CPBP family intramembrane metalloprotease [Verrucomicrobiota bacterium]